MTSKCSGYSCQSVFLRSPVLSCNGTVEFSMLRLPDEEGQVNLENPVTSTLRPSPSLARQAQPQLPQQRPHWCFVSMVSQVALEWRPATALNCTCGCIGLQLSHLHTTFLMHSSYIVVLPQLWVWGCGEGWAFNEVQRSELQCLVHRPL